MASIYLESVKKQLNSYKQVAEKTFNQLTEEQLFFKFNEESNSIASIVKHMSGNMLSRWTDFLTTDGEKPWRQRDAEFDNDVPNKNQLILIWDKGWDCLFAALNALTENDLTKIVTIRGEEHLAIDAINRQLAHYPYHVGQIVYVGKMLLNQEWVSLSIPKKSLENN